MIINYPIYILYLVLLTVGLFFVIKIGYLFFHNAWRYRKLPPYVNSFGSHLKLLDQYNWKSGASIVDLGCGDGKTLRYICRRFGIKKGVGYDLNAFATSYGRFINKLYKLSGKHYNIIIHNANIYSADLRGSDYIYIYLFPDFMAEMEDWLRSGCDKGTIIIANTFQFTKHESQEVIKNSKGKTVYSIYIV